MGASNRQTTAGDTETSSQFEQLPPNDKFKSKRGRCKHCNAEMAWNITLNLRPHLAGKCLKYNPKKRETPITSYFEPANASAEELFAYAVFTSTTNFRQFESPEWKLFFKKIGFKPPTRNELIYKNECWLDKIYDTTKLRVRQIADDATHIQLVCDGSSNITKDRVENISFLVDKISYYWQTTKVDGTGATTAGSDWSKSHIINTATDITRDRLHRWTAFSSDTDSAQQKLWSLIAQDSTTKHVLSVPCDSHGLQLVMKDLLWPSKDQSKEQITTKMSSFWRDFPCELVTYFSSAPKELAYVRDAMRAVSGKISALISTVKTRWGTQARSIKSVINNKVALQAYANNPAAAPTWKPKLLDEVNWQMLNCLYSTIYPIHEHQKMSESNRATLDKVYPRWMKINEHMQEKRLPQAGPFSSDIDEYCKRAGIGGWSHRMGRQLRPLHLTAYVLNPAYYKDKLLPSFQELLEDFIEERCGTAGIEQYYEYRTRSGRFNAEKRCWKSFADKPKLFWMSSVSCTFEF